MGIQYAKTAVALSGGIMNEQLIQLYQDCLTEGIPCYPKEPMAKHTSFRIGGPADLFITPRTVQQLQGLLARCQRDALPWTVVGRGSNLLVSDAGVEGVVLCLDSRFGQRSQPDDTHLYFPAGTPLSVVGDTACRSGLTGAEFAHGIPGTLGGAIFMNAGAYGGEMSQIVQEVQYLDREGTLHTLPGEACGFGYRRSCFQERGGCILGATLQLQKGDPAAIRARMDELMAARNAKQPLQQPSAGSTFKRPQEGQLAAAALIDRCGLRGLRLGDAMVSDKHTGFVVNVGNATADEVLRLTELIKTIVLSKEGIPLELEVQRLGRF